MRYEDILSLSAAERQNVIRKAVGILNRDGNNREALLVAGAGYLADKNAFNATKTLEKALALYKKDTPTLQLISRLYLSTNNFKKAKITSRKLCELDKKNAENWGLRGEILEAKGEIEGAILAYQKAQSLGINDAYLATKIGDCFSYLGNTKSAKTSYEAALLIDPDYATALYALATTGRLHADDAKALYKRAEAAMAGKENQSGTNKSLINYTAAKLLEKAQSDDDSFRFYKRANDADADMAKNEFGIQDSTSSPNNSLAFTNNRAVFTRDFFAKRPDYGSSSKQPIFIVGMPRSGTTLVESICATNNDIQAGGELPYLDALSTQLGSGLTQTQQYKHIIEGMAKEDVERFANSYLELCNDISGGKPFFTDKLPHNFLQVGLIQLLFPSAKIIHCRRHPVDTCLSIYTNPMNPIHSLYKSDLHTLGGYYKDYLDITRNWKMLFPDKILDVYYEDIVANYEYSSQRIHKFLGFDSSIPLLDRTKAQSNVKTLSSNQVRQPIYKDSVNKWHRVQNYLKPLIEALGDTIEVYENELEKHT